MENIFRRYRFNKKNVFVTVTLILVIIFLADFKQHSESSQSYQEAVQKKSAQFLEYVRPNTASDICSYVDPFHESMMKIMKDFGKHECLHPNELKLKVKNNKLAVSGYSINYISSKEIKIKGDSFEYGEDHFLLEAQFKDPVIKKGSFGALKNDASKLCINPDRTYKEKKSPESIDLLYSSECYDGDVVFTFTGEGYIKHNKTGMCFGLRDGDTEPKNDGVIVLKKKCDLVFEVLHSGVLRVASKYCVHPLGGGSPREDQKLCYYADCSNEPRLSFKFSETKKAEPQLFKKDITIEKELNYLKLGMVDSSTSNGYVLSAQRKKLDNLKPSSESKPNIFIIAFDETSSNHFKRKLPKSSSYLLNTMKAIDYRLHASNTELTPDNIIRILTGHGMNDKKEKTLFSVAKEDNYVNLFSSDIVYNNFSITLTDSHHNSIPLFRSMKTNYDAVAHQYCTLSQPIYDLSFDYLSSFIDSYISEAKFGMICLSEITWRNYNTIGYMDDSLLVLLKKIFLLKNTILFVTSIKGSTVGKLGKSPQGLIEYKRPLLNVHVSNDIQASFTLDKTRASQITSPFDIYSTIFHMITKKEPDTKYGLSLLKASTKKRDCSSAGVLKAMCPCDISQAR